jgi:hypothetical protein
VGVLKQQGTGECFAIGSDCLIGRQRGCALQVEDRTISYRHAELRWRVDHWELHDMGSTNGTLLDGRRLQADERAPLVRGSMFVLGTTGPSFTLIDDGPPMMSARERRSGRVRTAPTGMLLLPDDEHPEVSVLEDASGHWVAEDKDTQWLIEDREEIAVGDERWVISLPDPLQMTIGVQPDDPVAIENIAIELVVSRNEDHVHVNVLHGGKKTQLAEINPFYLLLLLARARLEDPDPSPGERGWIDRDKLCQMLRTTPQKLNVDVFRVRERFDDLGIRGAPNIIERRPGDLRIGIDRVEIVKM